MARAVLDSSVLVSAFLTPAGTSAAVLARARAFVLCLSEQILAETATVLMRPKHQKGRSYSPDEVDRYRNALAAVADLVTDLPALRAVPDDPKDDMVVATAVTAGACSV